MYKYADCARLMYAYEEAEKSYLRLEDARKPGDFPLLYLHLAQVNRGQGDYTAALAYLDKFDQETSGVGEQDRELAADVRNNCRWAQEHVRDARGIQVENLGKAVNSPYSDFAALQIGDTLYFSSYRFDKKGDRSKPRQKTTRLMWSVNGGRAREPGRGFPAVTLHRGPHGVYLRWPLFVFTNCKNISANDIRCEIYLTVRDIRGRWGKPQRLPEPVNLAGFTSTQPSIGLDSATMTEVLWFASDRPGGKGGMDIWSVPLDTIDFCPCNRPLSGRKFYMPSFPEPENTARANTAGADITPFFDDQEQALYFSSDGLPGFGGYDVYKLTSGDAAPQNQGPEINSSYNDLYFSLQPDGKQGLLSSNRSGSQYLNTANKACCNDIYKVIFPEPPPLVEADTLVPVPIALKQPVRETPVAPPVLKDFVGLPLYFDNDEPDKRTQRTTTRKNYEETVLTYLDRLEEYREVFSQGLDDAARETAESSIDDFFQSEVRSGYERLEQMCQLILQQLESGQKVEILIKGFTSPRAQSDYNLNLGKRRVSSVRNYFDAFENGVFRPYIRNGQLLLSETSFGETKARTGISDKLNDLRNSVYHPDAARERRVEIIGIQLGN
ncbi:MAG: hypothetical protein IPL65_13920 [Lewinellaceae bacterium]|nr:hypothetical protein [Lewinellaceae bacterium]